MLSRKCERGDNHFQNMKDIYYGLPQCKGKTTLTSFAYKLVLAGNSSRVDFLNHTPPQPNCAVVQGILNEILKIFHTN